jgi:predicted nucleic acid-binding protein
MIAERFTLDTNILVYAIDRDAGERHEKAMMIVDRAVEQHKISFWDAMLWAVAKQAEVKVLLSEDFQHERELEGIRFQNPFL